MRLWGGPYEYIHKNGHDLRRSGPNAGLFSSCLSLPHQCPKKITHFKNLEPRKERLPSDILLRSTNMSYTTYSKDIHVERRDYYWYLIATLATGGTPGSEGDGWNKSELNLGERFGNFYGSLMYNASGPISLSAGVARNVHVTEGGKMLNMELKQFGPDKEWDEKSATLDDKITNDYGVLKWVHPAWHQR